ncbi:MAG: PucR family transcriptional regulator ligand-binding domain-containing protein, partial [Actinobacteria bacterium]|nr:PucR family transcriptional regulator ligand-binding domain-containing protein [Actinomycetota bacterium]
MATDDLGADPPDTPLTPWLPVRDLLATAALRGSEVVAGRAGLDHLVERVRALDTPARIADVATNELGVTTVSASKTERRRLVTLVRSAADVGVAGLVLDVGPDGDGLPDRVLDAADERSLPLAVLRSGRAPDDVAHDVLADILRQHATRLARSEGIHRAFLHLVLAGGGLDAIVAQLSELTGAPAAILDTDRRVLARAGDDDRLDASLELRGGELLHGGEPIGTAVTVSAGSRVYGHVVALVDSDDARLALETAATVTALEIAKRDELLAVEAKYQNELMHDLLVGRARDRDDALARARTFGWDLDRRLICLVVQLDDPSLDVVPDEGRRRPPLAATIRTHIRERDPGAAVVRFSNEVVVLTAAFDGEDGRSRAKTFMRELIRRTATEIRAETSAGMGRPVTDVQDIPVAYEQATKALTIGRQVGARGTVAHFDDLGAYRLLSLVPAPDELRSFADETLGVLAGDDDAANDLRHTLEVLLETNCNVAEAARRLHFHYNTLRYRVEKLERILGPFTVDATTRLDVHLALLVHRMH